MMGTTQNYQSIAKDHHHHYHHPPKPRHPSFSMAASDVLRQKKHQRNSMVKLRLRISAVLLGLAVSSVVTMLINDQLILFHTYKVCSLTALTLKALTTLQSIALVILVWIFNYIQLRIFMHIRNINDISTALHVNKNRVCGVLIETVICLLHPVPFCTGLGPKPHLMSKTPTIESLEVHQNYSPPLDPNDIGESDLIKLSKADAILSVLTFLRLYQIGRYTVLHSRLFRTMLSYSLGALAQTKYNFKFVFTSYMARYKGYLLAAIALGFTATAAWCIYICDDDIVKYQDALWVVGITFFTIGYGDYSPVSKCSQIIAVITGFLGMFCMGISVSILSRYLQLTFDEYCMLSYYMDSDIEKQKREAAALIIKVAWQEYKARKDPMADMYTRLSMQRKLLKALHYKKDVEYKKISSRERRERQVPLYDMKEQMKKLTTRTEHVLLRQIEMEKVLAALNKSLAQLEDKLLKLYTITRKDRKPQSISEQGQQRLSDELAD